MERPLEKPADRKLKMEMKSKAPAKAASKQEMKPAPEQKPQEKISEEKKEEKKESKPEEKKEEKKESKPVIKKEEAVARGINLHASKKHCMYICSFIKNKPVDRAINELQEVIAMKRAVPFKGEIPHRHGKEMMAGRYPVKVSAQFIYLLKALKGNIISGNMDIGKARIAEASASWASRPQKRGGMRFKRTNVILKARELFKEEKNGK